MICFGRLGLIRLIGQFRVLGFVGVWVLGFRVLGVWVLRV